MVKPVENVFSLVVENAGNFPAQVEMASLLLFNGFDHELVEQVPLAVSDFLNAQNRTIIRKHDRFKF